MTTSNAINANSSGIVIYDGAGNFSADTTTTHNVLVGAASNGIANVAPGASGTVLASNGVSADPSFQSIPGVGVTVTNHATLVGGASNSITSVGPGTSGHVLTSNGAGADPSFQALPAATGVQTLTDGSANVVSPTGGTITFTNGNNISNLSGSPSTITFSVSGTTNHAVQVGNSSGSLTSIGLGTAGQALVSGGAASDPSFQVLPVVGGGSGTNSLTGVISGNGTSAFTASPVSQYASIVGGASNALSSVGPGAVGTVLAGNGASANPSFQTIPGLGTTVSQYASLVGGASNNIVSVAPSATSGVPLVSNGSSSNPSFSQATVPGGGTGLTSLTPYAVLAGGTTGTGNVQQVGIGTAGQVLTSNGAGALPSFQGSPGSRVAFSAYLTNNITNTTGDTTQYLCVFDTVSLNAGSGFSTLTGLFTAPVAGNYLFTFATRITTTSNISGGGNYVNYLVVNGSNLYKLFGNNRPDTGSATCNVAGSVFSIVISLSASDTVGVSYALTTDAGTKNTTITGDATNKPNNFSGTLL